MLPAVWGVPPPRAMSWLGPWMRGSVPKSPCCQLDPFSWDTARAHDSVPFKGTGTTQPLAHTAGQGGRPHLDVLTGGHGEMQVLTRR